MTIFGPDVSKWQEGLSVGDSDWAAIQFGMCRASIGNRTDAAHMVTWPAMRDRGKAYAAYHFVYETAKHSAVVQANALVAGTDGDTSVAVMLDVESDGSERPSWSDALRVADAIRGKGYRVTLAYLPHWYWQQVGSPSLAGEGIDIVSSNYGPNNVGEIEALYSARGGDAGPGWAGYGGVEPVIWQYGSQVEFGNKLVDMNAFRGSVDQLGKWFTVSGGGEGSDMPKASKPFRVYDSRDKYGKFAAGEVREIGVLADGDAFVVFGAGEGEAAGFFTYSPDSAVGDDTSAVAVRADGSWNENGVLVATQDRHIHVRASVAAHLYIDQYGG